MAISTVGSLYRAAGSKTLSVTPTTAGDVLVLWVVMNGGTTVTGVSGGGVTTWNKIIEGSTGAYASVWWGVITTTGAATVTITTAFSGTVNLGAYQFTAGAGMSWYHDGTGGTTGSVTPAASGNYSSLIPANTGELYFACAYLAGGGAGGATSGFTYATGSGGFEANSQLVFNASAPNPSAPAWTQSSGSYCTAAGMIYAATTPTGNSGASFLEMMQ